MSERICGDIADSWLGHVYCGLMEGHHGDHESRVEGGQIVRWPQESGVFEEITEYDKGLASELQQGGSHYRDRKIQPGEYAMANDFNYCESLALRYLTRHRHKNGAEDIRKAIHSLELLLQWEYGE